MIAAMELLDGRISRRGKSIAAEGWIDPAPSIN